MKRLLILSGKGGTGKTTTAAAFAAFARAHAVADCDVDAPNLHLVLQSQSESEKTPFIGAKKARIREDACASCGACAAHCRFGAIRRTDGAYRVNEYACEGCGVCEYVCPQKAVVLEEDVAGEQMLVRGDRVFSTAKLRMGRGNSGKLVTAVKLALLKNAPETDLAVIDGSPGIGCPVIASVSGMDLVLVVAEPSLSGLSDLERLEKTTRTFQTKLAVCVNKWDVSPQNSDAVEAFCRERGIPFVGRIPRDSAVPAAVNAGRSIAETDCPARDALAAVYERTMHLLNI